MSDKNGSSLARHVRVTESVRLLSPAFCACLLAACADAHGKERAGRTRTGLLYPVAYLCLPLVLHTPSRTAILAHNSGFGIHRLVHDHPNIIVGLEHRVQSLVPTTSDAILFGMLHGVLELQTADATLLGNNAVARRLTNASLGNEAMISVRAAIRLGTWIAQIHPSEAFLHFGLRV